MPDRQSRDDPPLRASTKLCEHDLAVVDQVEQMRRALDDYHDALNRRQHGDVAANRFVQAAQNILNLRRQEPRAYDHLVSAIVAAGSRRLETWEIGPALWDDLRADSRTLKAGAALQPDGSLSMLGVRVRLNVEDANA